ncbi:MAG: hypothetical protein SPI58_01285 [Candidatus Enteromonas sp.]|nr:hypothetical protein [Candidatus Enteromonas sp.]
MRRLALLNGAIVLCPKGLKTMSDYVNEYPDASFSRLSLEELVRLFFVPLSPKLYSEVASIIPLSQDGVSLLLSLFPSHPLSPRFQSISSLPLPPKRVEKAFFQKKNVVILGYHPLAGRIFASILQEVPNLSCSWGVGDFGKAEGLGVPMLEELYAALNDEELAELSLPSKSRFEGARKEERQWNMAPATDSSNC